jgi:hypothetical protein
MHCVNRNFRGKEFTQFLRHCVREGWADMATVHLDLGACVDGSGPFWPDVDQRPLVSACKNGHEEDADIVELLLYRGAGIDTTSRSLLVHAIEQEHEALFRLLMKRGRTLRRQETSVECVRVAKEQEFESMLKLLSECDMSIAL